MRKPIGCVSPDASKRVFWLKLSVHIQKIHIFEKIFSTESVHEKVDFEPRGDTESTGFEGSGSKLHIFKRSKNAETSEGGYGGKKSKFDARQRVNWQSQPLLRSDGIAHFRSCDEWLSALPALSASFKQSDNIRYLANPSFKQAYPTTEGILSAHISSRVPDRTNTARKNAYDGYRLKTA